MVYAFDLAVKTVIFHPSLFSGLKIHNSNEFSRKYKYLNEIKVIEIIFKTCTNYIIL